MKASRYLIALVVLIATAVLAPAALATNATDGATAQAGAGWDQATTTQGGWDNTFLDDNRTIPLGIANRPYVKYLSVTNAPDPTEYIIINNTGNVASPNALTPTGPVSDVYALVAPTNACNTTQAAAPGVCYNAPNRVTVSLMWNNVGTTFSPTFTGATTQPNINENSVIRLIIGFRSAYSTLRWSWVNGVPSYWKNDVIPGQGGTVEVRFTPKTMPVMNSGGCSAIPVSTCDITQASNEWLQPQIILSMDDTLDVGLTGVLFGSTSAFIGSLESSPIVAGQAPTLTYGIAAPHLNADGTDRRGTFYALIPSNILTLFGTSVSGFDSSILSVDRTGSAGSFTIGWSAWDATTNGTAGQLLTISDISFSAPKFQVARRGGSTATNNTGSAPTGTKGSGGNGNRVKVGSTTSFKALLTALAVRTKAGSKTSAKTTTPKVCTATKTGIKAIAVGTCKGTITVKPKTGKATKRNFTLVVTKTGKKLPVTLHR